MSRRWKIVLWVIGLFVLLFTLHIVKNTVAPDESRIKPTSGDVAVVQSGKISVDNESSGKTETVISERSDNDGLDSTVVAAIISTSGIIITTLLGIFLRKKT